MPELNYSVETIEDVPEEFKGLYVEEEKDGKKLYHLNVNGVKPQSEFDTVYGTLTKVREEKNGLEKQLKAFGEITPEKYNAIQEELDSLKKARNTQTEEDFLKRLQEVKNANAAEMQKKVDEFNKSEAEYKRQLEDKESTILEMRLENSLSSLYAEKGEPSGRELAFQIAKKELTWNPDAKEFRTKDGLYNLKDWMNDELFKRYNCLLKNSRGADARETTGSVGEYEKYFNPKIADFDNPNGEPYRKRAEFFRMNPEKAREFIKKYKS